MRRRKKLDREDLAVPGRTEAVILSLLLNGKELHGLEMVRLSNGILKRAAVYVYLHRMEQGGLVQSRLDENYSDRGPPRRKYRISAKGRQALMAREAAAAVFATVLPATN